MKKYVVRLTQDERDYLGGIVGRLSGTAQKVRRANILLMADADGVAWTDEQIAVAFRCRTRTVENVRRRFVVEGLETALHRKKRVTPPRAKKLDGKQEADIIALRLGAPPAGFANWTLRLLADRVVALEIVESISHETIRKVLKKTA